MNPNDLTGRVVIITGGTRGIGLGIATYLAGQGADVVITGRKAERVERVASDLGVTGMAGNVADRASVDDLVALTIERHGRVDGLVANAQSFRPVTPLAEVTDGDFDTLFDTGPRATLYLMQAVYPHFRDAGRGRIVTMGTALGLTGGPGYGPYAASNEAIRSLTRTAAREWGRDGVTANCVCPASAAHRLPPDDDGDRAAAFAAMYADHPLGRDGDPVTDIGPAVAFLLSDASQYVTGQTLMVDGGGIMR